MKEEKNKIDTLCDELVNEITDYDKSILEEWSNLKDDNRKVRRLLNRIKLSPEIEQQGENMKPTILKQVNKRINKEKQFRRILQIATVAASILILISITNYFSYQQGFRNVNSLQTEMYNPLGMLSTITLPDGSKVILNAGTTISYPNAFVTQNREVKIAGEAYFEIVHNADHPFIVKTEHIDIEVLGTQFNVKAYDNEEQIEVSLSEGKVAVHVEDLNRRSFLNPGEQAYYNKQTKTLSTRTVNITHYTSWKDGEYYFRALPLKEIASQLERIFNVRIYITSPELQNILLTGDFVRNENLEQILRVIEITADKQLKYRIEEEAIYIDENK